MRLPLGPRMNHRSKRRSNSARRGENPHSRTGRPLRIEPLEDRRVLDSTVVFNEVMYNPPGIDTDDSLEWIELYNQLAVNMDVSEWELEGGVDFTRRRRQFNCSGGPLDPVVGIPAVNVAEKYPGKNVDKGRSHGQVAHVPVQDPVDVTPADAHGNIRKVRSVSR